MKIAIVGEGETELGSRQGIDDDSTGAIFVRRLLAATRAEQVEVIPLKLSGSDLASTGLARKRGELGAATLAYNVAIARNCDAMVLFRDADNDAETRREQNQQGIAAAARSAAAPIPAVLGLQIAMLEAWLLADAGSFERAFGRRRSPLPRPPEQLWGERARPTSNHPKWVYRRILHELGVADSRQSAISLAEHADLEVLARECPDGFGRFKADFERAFRPFACVVAADVQNGIGKGNELPWPRLKGDLKHFRDLTSAAPTGKRNAVIMGRKTWDSVPTKYRPLPDRLNVVITRSTVDVPVGVLVARSLDDALNRACLAPDIDRLFVVGGGEIYRHAFAHVRCRDVYLTRVEHEFECDTFITDLHERFPDNESLGSHDDAGFSYTIQRLSRPPHA